ncbi:hypothetical protein HRUBRA_02864 [Pseudohaliea rubra DSM 19751]|uniref:Uncharacterized protein n=1 Tax=Pseudohaliea rubra DSM 19751 TaxID=1265313 RepID=A0A095WVE7_9GAMM|nr:hypothetical protein HRUBRA_02864 [Pseudohaliea rubra DSM 19751]
MKRLPFSRKSTTPHSTASEPEPTTENRPRLSRRRFIASSGVGLIAPTASAGRAFPSSNRHITTDTRWVKVWAAIEESHPLFPRYYRDGCSTLWIDFDRLTGACEPVSPNDDIYRWPVANALLNRPEAVPEEWQPEQWPRCLPLPPQDLEWEERAGWVHARQGAEHRWSVPRYVITILNRDILAGLDGSCHGDRRDQLRHHWMHCDLLTGMMVECAADDPLYESSHAAVPVLT